MLKDTNDRLTRSRNEMHAYEARASLWLCKRDHITDMPCDTYNKETLECCDVCGSPREEDAPVQQGVQPEVNVVVRQEPMDESKLISIEARKMVSKEIKILDEMLEAYKDKKDNAGITVKEQKKYNGLKKKFKSYKETYRQLELPYMDRSRPYIVTQMPAQTKEEAEMYPPRNKTQWPEGFGVTRITRGYGLRGWHHAIAKATYAVTKAKRGGNAASTMACYYKTFDDGRSWGISMEIVIGRDGHTAEGMSKPYALSALRIMDPDGKPVMVLQRQIMQDPGNRGTGTDIIGNKKIVFEVKGNKRGNRQKMMSGRGDCAMCSNYGHWKEECPLWDFFKKYGFHLKELLVKYRCPDTDVSGWRRPKWPFEERRERRQGQVGPNAGNRRWEEKKNANGDEQEEREAIKVMVNELTDKQLMKLAKAIAAWWNFKQYDMAVGVVATLLVPPYEDTAPSVALELALQGTESKNGMEIQHDLAHYKQRMEAVIAGHRMTDDMVVLLRTLQECIYAVEHKGIVRQRDGQGISREGYAVHMLIRMDKLARASPIPLNDKADDEMTALMNRFHTLDEKIGQEEEKALALILMLGRNQYDTASMLRRVFGDFSYIYWVDMRKNEWTELTGWEEDQQLAYSYRDQRHKELTHVCGIMDQDMLVGWKNGRVKINMRTTVLNSSRFLRAVANQNKGMEQPDAPAQWELARLFYSTEAPPRNQKDVDIRTRWKEVQWTALKDDLIEKQEVSFRDFMDAAAKAQEVESVTNDTRRQENSNALLSTHTLFQAMDATGLTGFRKRGKRKRRMDVEVIAELHGNQSMEFKTKQDKGMLTDAHMQEWLDCTMVDQWNAKTKLAMEDVYGEYFYHVHQEEDMILRDVMDRDMGMITWYVKRDPSEKEKWWFILQRQVRIGNTTRYFCCTGFCMRRHYNEEDGSRRHIQPGEFCKGHEDQSVNLTVYDARNNKQIKGKWMPKDIKEPGRNKKENRDSAKWKAQWRWFTEMKEVHKLAGRWNIVEPIKLNPSTLWEQCMMGKSKGATLHGYMLRKRGDTLTGSEEKHDGDGSKDDEDVEVPDKDRAQKDEEWYKSLQNQYDARQELMNADERRREKEELAAEVAKQKQRAQELKQKEDALKAKQQEVDRQARRKQQELEVMAQKKKEELEAMTQQKEKELQEKERQKQQEMLREELKKRQELEEFEQRKKDEMTAMAQKREQELAAYEQQKMDELAAMEKQKEEEIKRKAYKEYQEKWHSGFTEQGQLQFEAHQKRMADERGDMQREAQERDKELKAQAAQMREERIQMAAERKRFEMEKHKALQEEQVRQQKEDQRKWSEQQAAQAKEEEHMLKQKQQGQMQMDTLKQQLEEERMKMQEEMTRKMEERWHAMQAEFTKKKELQESILNAKLQSEASLQKEREQEMEQKGMEMAAKEKELARLMAELTDKTNKEETNVDNRANEMKADERVDVVDEATLLEMTEKGLEETALHQEMGMYLPEKKDNYWVHGEAVLKKMRAGMNHKERLFGHNLYRDKTNGEHCGTITYLTPTVTRQTLEEDQMHRSTVGGGRIYIFAYNKDDSGDKDEEIQLLKEYEATGLTIAFDTNQLISRQTDTSKKLAYAIGRGIDLVIIADEKHKPKVFEDDTIAGRYARIAANTEGTGNTYMQTGDTWRQDPLILHRIATTSGGSWRHCLQRIFNNLESSARMILWNEIGLEHKRKADEKERQRLQKLRQLEMAMCVRLVIDTRGKGSADIIKGDYCEYCQEHVKAATHWFCIKKKRQLGLIRQRKPNVQGLEDRRIHEMLLSELKAGRQRRSEGLDETVRIWLMTKERKQRELKNKRLTQKLDEECTQRRLEMAVSNRQVILDPFRYTEDQLTSEARRTVQKRQLIAAEYDIDGINWKPRRLLNGRMMRQSAGWICKGKNGQQCFYGNSEDDHKCKQCEQHRFHSLGEEATSGQQCLKCGWVMKDERHMRATDGYQEFIACGCTRFSDPERFDKMNWRQCLRCQGVHQRSYNGKAWAIHIDNVACPWCGSLVLFMAPLNELSVGQNFINYGGPIPLELIPEYDPRLATEIETDEMESKAAQMGWNWEPSVKQITLMLYANGDWEGRMPQWNYWPKGQMYAVWKNQFILLCGAKLTDSECRDLKVMNEVGVDEDLEVKLDDEKVETLEGQFARRRHKYCRMPTNAPGHRCTRHTGTEREEMKDSIVFILPRFREDLGKQGVTENFPTGYWTKVQSLEDIAQRIQEAAPRKHGGHEPITTDGMHTPSQMEAMRKNAGTLGSGTPTPRSNRLTQEDHRVSSPLDRNKEQKEQKDDGEEEDEEPVLTGGRKRGKKRERPQGDTPERAQIVKAQRVEEEDEDEDLQMAGAAAETAGGPTSGNPTKKSSDKQKKDGKKGGKKGKKKGGAGDSPRHKQSN